jgi:hypothetical protein
VRSKHIAESEALCRTSVAGELLDQLDLALYRSGRHAGYWPGW